jgi:hypothetical protein
MVDEEGIINKRNLSGVKWWTNERRKNRSRNLCHQSVGYPAYAVEHVRQQDMSNNCRIF